MPQEHLTQFALEHALPWTIHFLIALLIFIVGRMLARLISKMIGRLLIHTKLDIILVEFVQQLVNALLLIVVIIAALDQMGVNTTSLIAILGAAGLAIGLALQGSLQNFAAGFLLLLFRPFKAGDFIEAANTMGVVEKISIFSTIMRTGDNKEVIVPNGAIYSNNIINYSARPTRRIDLVFGIGYDDDMKKARDVIAAVLAEEERVLTDPAPVIAVSELAANSVNFVVRPWVKTDDYWPVRFALTEKIKQAFDDQGITIPYPQMDVHLHKPE
jgi:small conductance mechanosensitive channel